MLKTLLEQGISEPIFYGDLVYKFKRIVGKPDFSDKFKKIIKRYIKVGYNLDVMRQSTCLVIKVSKGAKIRSRYNQVPHPTQDTNGKVTNSQLDTTNESQEVSPFSAGDHKAHINRRAQRHSKPKTEQKKNPQKKYRLGTDSKIFYWRA